ncbi:MAG TPA: Co2+/Mg2+ efflux protein ApaG [Saprospiraceae bacterium]|nr:Co2+/Mg2+ efflux protein ApaG [Saprospiraceae bacterium]
MDIAVTNGITVAVETQFLPMHSNAREDRFIFAYHILIENGSPYTVQLLGRHWYIHDGPGRIREVEGEGVVGQQPIIPPGEKFEYNSYCDLGTEIGKMRGYYLMNRLEDDTKFQVEIPEFKLIEPSLSN